MVCAAAQGVHMQRTYSRASDLASVPGRKGRYPISVATLWRWVAQGKFPAPVRLSPGVTAWASDAVEAWERQQLAGATPAGTDTAKAAAASVAARRARRSAEVS